MAFKIFAVIRARFFNQASDAALEIGLNGEENPRFKLDGGGRISWGAGNVAPDVNLYRSDVNVLKSDDLFQALLGVVTLTTAGIPGSAAPDGTLAVDTTNDIFYFRSGDAWLEVSGGANVLIQSNEPASAENGDLWFDSDDDFLYIYNGANWVSVTGSLTLGGLEDVSLADLEDGQILKYSSASQHWYNEYEIPTNVDGGDASANYGGIVSVSGGGAAG